MLRRILIYIPLMVFILCYFPSGLVLADLEPNNSIAAAELVGAGSHTGLVDDDTDPADVDYYRVMVPVDHDLKVTLENTDAGKYSELHLRMYDGDRNEIGGFRGINLHVDYGESESDDWSNPESGEATIYLEVYGDGFYTLKIELEESSVGLGMVLCVLIILSPIIFIVAAVVLIMRWKKKKDEKREQEQMLMYSQRQMQSQRKKYQKPISEYTVELNEDDIRRFK
jgi:Na+-transporting methylmalonyl-CoA/oxaloacetate decarboxylase gamma subunit